MKAFEEMMKEEYPSVRLTSADGVWAAQIWKAALEWLQREHAEALDYDEYWVVDAVKKELDE